MGCVGVGVVVGSGGCRVDIRVLCRSDGDVLS